MEEFLKAAITLFNRFLEAAEKFKKESKKIVNLSCSQKPFNVGTSCFLKNLLKGLSNEI
jgi:hypothetical protein